MILTEKIRAFLQQCSPHHRDREWYRLLEESLATPVSASEPMQYLEGISDLPGLVRALGYQKQCDEDGVMCEVSRQAVEEARTVLARMVEHQQTLWRGQSAPSHAGTPQPSSDARPSAAEQIAGATELTDSGWTVEAALRFYAEGKHFDAIEGRTRIIDTGAIASDALKGLSPQYAAMKGTSSDAWAVALVRRHMDMLKHGCSSSSQLIALENDTQAYLDTRPQPSAYICKCGLRVVPHRCSTEAEF